MYETKPRIFRLEPDHEDTETTATAVMARAMPAPSWERSHYQPSGRSTPMAFIGSLLAVCGLLSALLWLNIAPAAKAKHGLTVVNLTATPPPPQPQPAPQPQQSASLPDQPRIVAPPPIVPTASPQTVTTTPQPYSPPTIVAAPAAPAAPAPPAPAPMVASAGDLSSTMISAKAPTYPLESRRKHEEGTVVLKLLLSTDGQVADISVTRSSGWERLDRAALAAVREWRWKPMIRNGETVMVQGMVTIPFVLKR